MNDRPRVVIVGAGFGGLRAAAALKNAPVDVVLIDRFNYHTFQPLLYQVATSALEPGEIASTVRGIFHHQKNFAFELGNVVGVDWEQKALLLEDEPPVPFNYLILAAGASTNYFGIDGAEQYSFPMKTVDEANALRNHIITVFEEVSADPELIDEGWLNFVVVGGGPTGVEMAGALSELFDMVLRKDYPRLDMNRAHVVLLEASDKVLAPFAPNLRSYTLDELRKRHVDVRLGEAVTKVTEDTVYLKSGGEIRTRTVVWGAGIRGVPMANGLGVEVGRGGRVVVNDDLSLPGHPEAFVIGDLAASKGPDGNIYPQLARVAIDGGKHAARMILRHMQGLPGEPFIYKDPGTMATIGRNAAVAQLPGDIKLKGFLAWSAWVWLHLWFLVGFRNRVGVFVSWVWNYFTYDRGVRMIMPTPRRRRHQFQAAAKESEEIAA
ncbi:MAG: NAD(P)/FAD-dependent oxidoreductase [Anaerolineae bacterium]